MSDLLQQKSSFERLNGDHIKQVWELSASLSISELLKLNNLTEDMIPQGLEMLSKDFPVEAGGSMMTHARPLFQEGTPSMTTIKTKKDKLIISFRADIWNPTTKAYETASISAKSFADADRIKNQALENPNTVFAITVACWKGETSKGEEIRKYAASVDFGRKAEKFLSSHAKNDSVETVNTTPAPQADAAKVEVKDVM